MPKTNKLSIYLIKPEYQLLEDIVESETPPLEIPSVGKFFSGYSNPRPPDWIGDFFGNILGTDHRILTSSARGLLICPIQQDGVTVNLAIAFGVGRHLLKEGVVEERFGLKVVLNSVNQESFRSITKVSLGSVAKQSHEQMTRDVSASEFGIDIEQDLIGSITGKSNDARLGKMISGKDALSVSVPVDITNVPEFLAHCLERHKSIDYRRDFDWIDQIADIRTPQLQKALNTILVEKIARGDLSKIWMAVPEILDWADVKGFRYAKRKRADLYDDLEMSVFLASIDGAPLTLEILKDTQIFMIKATNDDEGAHWPAFRCIYAEIELDGHLHVLNNGKWYKISGNFTAQVMADYADIRPSSLALPNCTVNDEFAYNSSASAEIAGACCMDKKLIMHGGEHSKVEFCDVYTSDKKIVHVKKYGGSSVLSHLFAQGVVSGELFVSETSFREKLNMELPDSHKLSDTSIRPIPTEHEVVYGIISKVDGPLDIPFFSKVSLRNARRRLLSYGYKVALNRILKVAHASDPT